MLMKMKGKILTVEGIETVWEVRVLHGHQEEEKDIGRGQGMNTQFWEVDDSEPACV